MCVQGLCSERDILYIYVAKSSANDMLQNRCGLVWVNAGSNNIFVRQQLFVFCINCCRGCIFQLKPSLF